MSTIGKLRQGQKNLDWMRKEVEDTVSMLVGFVYQTGDTTRREVHVNIPADNCIWHVDAVVNCSNRDYDNVTISCSGKICHAGDVVAYRHKVNYPFHPEFIQDVYGGLEALGQGLIANFPYIVETDGWKALMRAADVPRV